ncbi:MAG: GTP-sensing pleiotropic transcriptional regulator CodY [Aerococcus sp.]|nr:GTP-sensing pleiotropic transcriptional regulator CodY [Aerococcus sp.]
MANASELLAKIRRINEVIRDDSVKNIEMENDFPFQNLVAFFGEVIDSNVYLISLKGHILGHYSAYTSLDSQRTEEMIDARQLSPEYIDGLRHLDETEANIAIDDDRTLIALEKRGRTHGITTIIPIYGNDKKMGYLLFARPKPEFTDEDLILAEYVATVLALQMQFLNQQIEEKAAHQQKLVASAVQSLSFSEIVALQAIFRHGDKPKFRITASRIAEEEQITRSVIVNALRKMESAGVLVSHSLGMKGTFIDALNEENFEEIKKQLNNF